MRAIIALVLGAGAALPLSAGFAFADGEGDDAAMARGRALAERLCVRCHAIGPEDNSAFGPAPPFRIIARRYEVSHLAEAFAEGIVVGHPAMPVFEFEPPTIGDLLAYLESLENTSSEESSGNNFQPD